MITVDFNRLELPEGARVLDIGCGSGRHTAAACELPRATAIGIDIGIEDLEQAKERLKFHDRVFSHGRGTWNLLAADTLHLPFSDGCFDLVICSEVLEHIHAHQCAVQEAARVLARGGTMAVSVPRYYPESICWKLSKDYAGVNQGHIRIYRKPRLLSLLQDAGLTPVASHHAHSLHTPYWWLKCLVGPTRENVRAVDLYHRFLTWDIMKKPRLTGLLDRLLNPVLGKSLVVYSLKNTPPPVS
jgi:ubiquinone/menaquinone biosynthesis C-methylase UbiE